MAISTEVCDKASSILVTIRSAADEIAKGDTNPAQLGPAATANARAILNQLDGLEEIVELLASGEEFYSSIKEGSNHLAMVRASIRYTLARSDFLK